jgi:hypothetical protein
MAAAQCVFLGAVMLEAHSLTEAQLYLKITACKKCSPEPAGMGKLNQHAQSSGNMSVVRVRGQCSGCCAAQELDFALEQEIAAPAQGHAPAINLTEKRSQIIDVGQWLTLSQLFIQESQSEKNRSKARLLNLQAAQCLSEALKFYDDSDNDLPPSDALFCASSRRRFHEFPQQFSRGRLISEKRKLPVNFDEFES